MQITPEEGRWLAAFDAGRWTARFLMGRWAVQTSEWQEPADEDPADPRELLGDLWVGDEDDAPEPVRAAFALHARDWLDTTGALTVLGRAALQRWAAGEAG